MKKQSTHIRVWESSLKKLRLIHSLLDESHMSIINRLLSEELKKISKIGEALNEECDLSD